MESHTRALSRLLLPLAILALPVVLLLSSLQMFRELDEQRTVYLRDRTAAVAGRLETLPGTTTAGQAFELLGADDPSLAGLEFIERSQSPSFLAPIWEGKELFRMESVTADGRRLFRAYVPFHSDQGMRIARIDLDAASAGFLVAGARRNIAIASISGSVLLLVGLYAMWAARRAARLELRQAELEHLAHLGKMSAVLAHEIRNPLGTIKGFAQLIGEQAGSSVDVLLRPILSETGRLESLVNDLLLYGRPPAPVLRHAKWEETLIPVEAHARQMIGARPIRFVADRPGMAWRTDPGLLEQALLNVLRNAIEAIPDGSGGAVKLAVRREGRSGVLLSVLDDGAGISEGARARLFEPFFTTKAAGTGLGLAITRNLVQSLGGDFTLRPVAPRGTEAVFRFPSVSVSEFETNS